MPDERHLSAYADLVVRVGLNLQPGQRLFVCGYRSGVPLDAAPFARRVVDAAYDAGARHVVVLWEDEVVARMTAERMPDAELDRAPDWYADSVNRFAVAGDALLTLDAGNPHLYASVDPARIARRSAALLQRLGPTQDVVANSRTNWCLVAAATPAWAQAVFGDPDPDAACERLWSAILHAVRADLPDPVAAWRQHMVDLARRRDHLTGRSYRALHAFGGGTDVVIGLADGHEWHGAGATTPAGLPFVPNLPTEEVFTAPHRLRVDGVVRGTHPVSVGGQMVDGWELELREGAVVAARADRGEDVLRALIATDPGAARLGEVALVGGSSPTRETGIAFDHALFEENVACHIALGRCYPPTIGGGSALTHDELEQRGGNWSLIHTDIMWGSSGVDVDGVREDGTVEPLLRGGEWAW